VYFAVGYLHAQDRLWQMELMRRAGEGRLAEVLGEPALKIDRMFRTLGSGAMPGKHFPSLMTGHVSHSNPTPTVSRIHPDPQGEFPIEFDLLDIEPEPWAIEHSLLISRLMPGAQLLSLVDVISLSSLSGWTCEGCGDLSNVAEGPH